MVATFLLIFILECDLEMEHVPQSTQTIKYPNSIHQLYDYAFFLESFKVTYTLLYRIKSFEVSLSSQIQNHTTSHCYFRQEVYSLATY